MLFGEPLEQNCRRNRTKDTGLNMRRHLEGTRMHEFHWSEWYPLSPRDIGIPDEPGIYEIRTDYEFGRLRGSSRVVYIGSTMNSLKQRLVHQRIKEPSRTEKLLRKAGHALEFRFATATDGETAKRMEAQRLMDYEREHWELPPGNGVMPYTRLPEQERQEYIRWIDN